MNTQLYYAYQWSHHDLLGADESVPWDASVYSSLSTNTPELIADLSARQLYRLVPQYSQVTYPVEASWINVPLPYQATLLPAPQPKADLQMTNISHATSTSQLSIASGKTAEASVSLIEDSYVASASSVAAIFDVYVQNLPDILYSRRPLNAPITTKFVTVQGHTVTAELALAQVKAAAAWQDSKVYIPPLAVMQSQMYAKRTEFAESYANEIMAGVLLNSVNELDQAYDNAFDPETGSHAHTARLATLAAARGQLHHDSLIRHTHWLPLTVTSFETRVRAAEHRAGLLRHWARRLLFRFYQIRANLAHASLVSEYLAA